MKESEDSTRQGPAREKAQEAALGEAREEAAVARALELLEAGVLPDLDEKDHDLVLEYLETWTALPLHLEPAAPQAETKETLLHLVSGSPRKALQEAIDEPILPFRKPVAKAPPYRVWALAATLAAAVISLGLFSLSLSQKVASLSEKVQKQEAHLAALLLPAPLGHMEAELTSASFTFQDLPEPTFDAVAVRRSLFFQVDSGDGTSEAKANTQGGMLVCAKHRRWLLNLQGLEPLQSGEQYHLWFVTEGGPIHVGLMEMTPDHTVQASADRLPASILGLLVSKEGDGSVGAKPAGPILARANRPVVI